MWRKEERQIFWESNLREVRNKMELIVHGYTQDLMGIQTLLRLFTETGERML